jgi:hypothetical protein
MTCGKGNIPDAIYLKAGLLSFSGGFNPARHKNPKNMALGYKKAETIPKGRQTDYEKLAVGKLTRKSL